MNIYVLNHSVPLDQSLEYLRAGVWLTAVVPGAGQVWAHNKPLNPQDIFVEYMDKSPNKKMSTEKQDMTEYEAF